MYVKVDFGAERIVLVGERLQRDNRIMPHIRSKCLFAFCKIGINPYKEIFQRDPRD